MYRFFKSVMLLGRTKLKTDKISQVTFYKADLKRMNKNAAKNSLQWR